MVVKVVGNYVELNKYKMESMTLRFDGVPTCQQAISAAKSLSIGCSMKPAFNSPIFEVHMSPDNGFTKVQFYPNVLNGIVTTYH